MDIIKRIKGILEHPSKFYDYLVKEKDKKEKGVRNAFVYHAVLSLFAVILGTLIGLLMQPVVLSIIGKFLPVGIPINAFGTTTILSIVFAVIGYGIGLGMIFVTAALLYVWILIFGGKGSYTDTFNLTVYSSTPGYLFKWIPVIGWFTWIWGLILLIIGTQKLHKLPKMRSVLMYVIPIIVSGVLAILVMIFVFALLGVALSTSMIPIN